MIYLGGGGSEDDEANVWKQAFSPGPRVFIWPFAQPKARWPGIHAWIKGTDYGKSMCSQLELAQDGSWGLDYNDMVFIPGGNTFALLSYMKQHRLVESLKEFLAAGGRVYGGSAGAVVMGADIGIIDAAAGGQDVNESELQDLQGLDLLRGAVVYPHYGENGENESKLHCKRWAIERMTVVIGIREKGGLIGDGEGGFVNAGPKDALVFCTDGSIVEVKEGDKLMY